jgi:hypothetical protein
VLRTGRRCVGAARRSMCLLLFGWLAVFCLCYCWSVLRGGALVLGFGRHLPLVWWIEAFVFLSQAVRLWLPPPRVVGRKSEDEVRSKLRL